VADEHEHGLVRLTLDIYTFNEGKRRADWSRRAEQEEDEVNNEDEGQPQQADNVAAELTAEKAGGRRHIRFQ
jgi:hypothetical protein